MSVMEQIVRPFTGEAAGSGGAPPPANPAPPAIGLVGFKGGGKIFTGSYSWTQSFRLGAVHTEAASGSDAINNSLSGDD